MTSPGRSLPLIFCIHMRSGPIYWGVIYLAKKIIRWWYFTCKKPENIICDGVLHVNMFRYFKIPYFTCNFFTNFTYNEYIGPYFLSHIVLRFSPSDLPEMTSRCLRNGRWHPSKLIIATTLRSLRNKSVCQLQVYTWAMWLRSTSLLWCYGPPLWFFPLFLLLNLFGMGGEKIRQYGIYEVSLSANQSTRGTQQPTILQRNKVGSVGS
jgi:hypothetical protein